MILDNNLHSGNEKKSCLNQVLGDAYFTSLKYVPARVNGSKVIVPVFVNYVYNDMCVFNNTDRVINILYKDQDGSIYDINLPIGEFYSHRADSIINTNSLKVRALNGANTQGSVDFYFNSGSIPPTTTIPFTTTTSTSTTSRTFTTGTSSTTSSSTTTSSIQAKLIDVGNWDSSDVNQRMMVYYPSGYDASQTQKLYPWAIYLHDETSYGAGTGPNGIDKIYKTGVPKFLKGGDRPYEYIIIAPQIKSGSFTDSTVEKARLWALFNLNVDSTRLTLIGTSIGGSAAGDFAQAHPDRVAMYFATPGFITMNPAANVGALRPVDVPGYFYGGAQDTYIPPTSAQLYLDLANDQTVKPLYPFLFEEVWGKNHTYATWEDGVYNRKYRSNGVGTSKFDWIEDFGKKYKTGDRLFNATKRVEVAETTIDFNDYLMALRLVKKLPTGINRTVLEVRLSAVANNIRVNRRIFILSFGSTPAVNGPYNNIANPTPGAISTPFKDINNVASPYTFTPIITNWTTTTSTYVGLKNDYFGFDSSFHETAFKIYNQNNMWRLSNLKPDKLYDLRIYFADTLKSTVDRGGGNITINGVTKLADAQSYNTHRFIEFTSVQTNQGVIDINLSSIQANYSLEVTGLLIEEQVNSNVYVPNPGTTSTSSTTQAPVSNFTFFTDMGDLDLGGSEVTNSYS